MSTVSSNLTFKFDGVNGFTVGGDVYSWSLRALPHVDFHAPSDPIKTVSVSFASSWDLDTLTFAGTARAVLRDIDSNSGRTINVLRLASTDAVNIVELKTTAIGHILGGEGVDQVTLGNAYYQSVQLNGGNNVLKTGAADLGIATTGGGNDTITIGSGYLVSVDAGSGNNTVSVGTGEVEFLFAGNGRDSFTTSSGYVGLIDTGRGRDVVNLGSGGAGSVVLSRDADTINLSKLAEPGVVFLNGGEGVTSASERDSDTVNFTKFTSNFTIDLRGVQLVETGAGDFVLNNFENATGGSGSEVLIGNTEANILKGGAGNDRLEGGFGADKLYGGSGADRFLFKSIKDSTVSSEGRDKIYDFSRSQGDKIDLKAIDADTKASGSQAFEFIGSKKFSKDAGELRYEKTGSDTVLSGDINGDGKADFTIALDTLVTLKATDFIL